MTTGMIHDQSLEKHMKKQMGCMTGFLQIFDRHQLLTGKRLYTTKRLPAAKGGNTSPETEKSDTSPEIPEEPEKPKATRTMTSPSPDRYKSPQQSTNSPAPASPLPVETPLRSSLPHPIFELNEATKYSWKFNKETPRLSLDSRATFDAAKGSLYPNRCNNSGDGSDDKSRRSTSVIARLMGLESLPNSSSSPSEPIGKQAELRRSASESRVSRDIFQNRLSETNNYQQKQQNQVTSNVIRERNADPINNSSKILRTESARATNRGFKSPQQRKSFFDSTDFFPEPKQTTVSIYGEIERRLKMKGIDEQSQDLETLKQILEAMQLKGLLHSKKPSTQIRNKNIVYERNHSFPSNEEQSPIVLMRPVNRRVGNDSPPSSHRSKSEYRRSDSVPVVTPRRSVPDRSMKSPTRARNASSPTRSENNVKNSNVRRNQLISETHSRVIESPEHRRMSPINSPRRRSVSDQTATNRYPANRKSTVQIHPKNKISTTFMIEDESSSAISESTVSTPSQTDTERCKSEEFKEGKSLLERCDKLLQSIADMNATELQPSPVSVLDSSFYKDDSLSPSPVMKRTISFTDESEEEIGSLEISSVHSKFEDEIDDADYIYISEILRASSYFTEEADIFWFVEKQKYGKGKETRLQRKLIFDTVIDILNRNKQIPPWKAFCSRNSNIPELSVRQIWSEIRRIQELNDQTTDLFGIVCGVLKKDLAGDGWGDFPVEMSEAVLDIERLIFKDLIGESIRDLAVFAGKCSFLAPRRKLVF